MKSKQTLSCVIWGSPALKITVTWDVMPGSLWDIYVYGTYKQKYIASYPWREQS